MRRPERLSGRGLVKVIKIEESELEQHYATREAQERIAALNSLDPVMRAVHLARAAHYAAKAAARERSHKT
jgi:hypothetical protein